MTSKTRENALRRRGARTKSLRWASTCLQYSIVHINDMSPMEIHQTWYNDDDYIAFRKDCRKTVKLSNKRKNLHSGGQFGKNIVCIRGLERNICRETENIRYERKHIAIATVLEEQADQIECGTIAPDFLADLYQELSEPSRRDAHLQGLKDEQDARACHRPEARGNEVVKISKTTSLTVNPIKLFAHFRSSNKNGRSLLLRQENAMCLISPMA